MKENPNNRFLKQVFSFLNQNIEYAVLRNFEGLPDFNLSRDIDIIVREKDFYYVRNRLITEIEKQNYKIVTYYCSERLITFVCGATLDNSISMVQLDFFLSCSVKGLFLISADDMLKSKIQDNNVWHVNSDYEFLDKYCYLKALGVPYPEKYKSVLERAKSSKTINAELFHLFGIETIETLLDMSKSQFWKIALKKHGSIYIKQTCRFIKWHVHNRMNLHGISVGFTGPDGSGKTTVINGIIAAFQQVQRTVPLYHFRPTIMQNLGDAAYSAGIKKKVDHEYDKPHRGKKQGIVSSFVRLVWYTIDYIIGYWIMTRMLLSNRNVIIFDRYYTDIVVDSKRSKIYLSNVFLYIWGKMFIPSLDYNILLTAHSEVILNRKKELTKEAIDDINEKLTYLKDKSNYYMFWNESTPEVAITSIIDLIFSEQHCKNLKRLK